MTVCVFLGPSLPLDDARTILPATYLPPVKRGDILEVVRRDAPAAIAVIDGYFEGAPSVWHKEILWALDQGIPIYGAASMGALRAAELSQFGMVGVGKIFNAYACGKFAPFDEPFEDDDEVAVVHGPAEAGYPSSCAMVDVRATLSAAGDALVVTHDEVKTLAATAKAIFYKDRTWRRILDACSLPSRKRADLLAWVQENGVSQKRLDAIALLMHLRDVQRDSSAIPPFRFERTLLWEQAKASDR